MRKLLLIFLICLATVDAFRLKNFVSRFPSEISEHDDSQDKVLNNLLFDTLEQNETVFMNWFNFTLVYFIDRNRTFQIKHQNEFFEIGLVYKPKYRNVFILHGWQNSYGEDVWLDQMKDTILKADDEKVNVFIVDWSKFAKLKYYYRSAKFTKIMGAQLAKFIIYLEDHFLIDPNNVHMIGHSLGAHAAGFTGKALKKFNIKIGKITGLDPAGPGFTTHDINERLDKTDAQFVEVLHTNMGYRVAMGLGIALKIGHVDIFLNGGARQNGCRALLKDSNHDQYYPISYPEDDQIDDSNYDQIKQEISLPSQTIKKSNSYKEETWSEKIFCHHSRGVDYYMESPEFAEPCQAIAYECPSYREFLMGNCYSCGENNENCYAFGYFPKDKIQNPPVDKAGKSYFVRTNAQLPLCANHYQVEIEYGSSDFDEGEFEITLYGENDKMVDVVKGRWDTGFISALIITEKNLGKLTRATGRFLKSWWDHWDQDNQILI